MSRPPRKNWTETELISWAIPKIAQGHYAVSNDANGRELWINEGKVDLTDMEGELSHGREPVEKAILDLRESCTVENIRCLLVLLFGRDFGCLLAQDYADFVNNPWCYQFAITAAYNQEKSLIKDVQLLPRRNLSDVPCHRLGEDFGDPSTCAGWDDACQRVVEDWDKRPCIQHGGAGF